MKRKVMVLFLAALVLALVIIAAPVAASNNFEKFTPPTDKPGPGGVATPVEVICITCADGQTQSCVGYGASTIPLD